MTKLLGISTIQYIGNKPYRLTEARTIGIYEKITLEPGETITLPSSLAKQMARRSYFILQDEVHMLASTISDDGIIITPIQKLPDMLYRPYAVAMICHEVNKSYCEAIGDNSQVSWDEAPEWQKTSALNGVLYHLQHPDSTPADSHNKWLEEKEADGWKYGKVKNPEKKEHPCFVPYEKLPKEQKAKDYIFSAIVKSMLVADLITPPIKITEGSPSENEDEDEGAKEQ